MEGLSATVSTLWGNIVDGGALMIRTTTFKISGWDMGEETSSALFYVLIIAIVLFVAMRLKAKRRAVYLMESGQLHSLYHRPKFRH